MDAYKSGSRLPRRSTGVLLTIVSPCEHGSELRDILAVPAGAEFGSPYCKDSRGRHRYHKATEDKYPNVEEFD